MYRGMGARSRSIAMASMPHSMPLPGPSRPHVKTVNCPVRNVGSATVVSRTGAPCAMMADLRHVDGVPGREPFARGHRHRDDGIGLRYHRLEDLTLVCRRVGQHGVQDDDAWHPDLVQQVQDLAAVGSAVDAVLVLHDGDVAPVQLRGRPVDRGGVIGDKLRYHLVAGSWCGRVDEANDPALVGGGVQEGVA